MAYLVINHIRVYYDESLPYKTICEVGSNANGSDKWDIDDLDPRFNFGATKHPNYPRL